VNGAYYRDTFLNMLWISQEGFVSFDRNAPRRIKQATPSLSWSDSMHSSKTVVAELIES